MFNRHRHDWNLIDKTEKEGMMSKALRAKVINFKQGAASDRLMADKVIFVFKCNCGKVRIEERW